MYELRDDQLVDLGKIRAAYREGHRSVLYQRSTGGGKTIIFNHLARSVAAHGRKVCIAVHRIELIQQNIRMLEAQEISYGVIAPGYSLNKHPVQIASIWTLTRRLSDWQGYFDLLIVDEAHHMPAGAFANVFNAFGNIHKLLVTATPARLDGIGLADFADVLITGPSMSDLIKQGWLAPCDVYGPPNQLDLTGVHSRMGDYVQKELESAVDTASITGDAVEHYRKLVGGRPAVCFCVSIKHCEHVAERFRQAGYRSASIDGTMDRDQRQRLIQSLANGSLNVLTSCEILLEGVDVPICQAVIMLRPTQSLTLYLQACGRAMRPKADADGNFREGGRHAGDPMILLDHVGNCAKHGLPDAPREWSLIGRKRSAKDTPPSSVRVCEFCYCVFAIHLRVCPKCGRAVIIQSREIKEVPGQLVRLTPDERLALWKEEQRNPNSAVFAPLHAKIDEEWERKERARLELVAIRKGVKGNRAGWVEHVLQAKKKKRQMGGEHGNR